MQQDMDHKARELLFLFLTLVVTIKIQILDLILIKRKLNGAEDPFFIVSSTLLRGSLVFSTWCS